jgi:hypothetical protein
MAQCSGHRWAGVFWSAGFLVVAAAGQAQPTLVEYSVESAFLGQGPQGIAPGPDVGPISGPSHAVWFANVGAAHSLGSVTVGGDTSDHVQPSGDAATGAITAAGAGAVYAGGNQHIFWLGFGGSISSYPLDQQFHQIDSIGWDGVDTVWFTDFLFSSGQRMLGRLHPSTGNYSTISLPSECGQPGLFGRDMVKGIDGNMWFIANGSVCRITVDIGGTATVDSVAVPTGMTTGIASGPDGRIWVGAYDGQHGYLEAFPPAACPGPSCSSQISVYPISGPPPSAGREVHGIAAGPDGRMWFVYDKDGEGVGSVKTDGTDVQTIPLPDRPPNGNRPHRITAGPAGDNSVWFTEPSSARIGRITGLASPTELLLQGGRFKLDVTWQVPPQGTSGVGTAVPIAPDTGAFWFFSPSNFEMMVKVLDGRAINGHWWVFLGALTNVQFDLTVTDLGTGAVWTYHNPYGTQPTVQDTSAFSTFSPPPDRVLSTTHEVAPAIPGLDPADLVRAELASGHPATARATSAEATDASCTPDATSLCLTASRFKVQVAWSVPSQGTSGNGTAIALTADTGVFWFFSSDNLELILKVLDARVINNHFWVFYGPLSNVQYTITITDTQTNAVKTYFNPYGSVASVADTSAF